MSHLRQFPHTCRLLLLVAVASPLNLVAGFKPGAGWPAVSTPFFHAVSPGEAGQRQAHWLEHGGFFISAYQDTGSMRPFLSGGHERLVMEPCRPETPLAPGLMVQFNRGDVPAVLHYIAAISRNGRSLYLSGINNRSSDGWFPRSRVAFIVREIITAPVVDTGRLPPASRVTIQGPPRAVTTSRP
jgi:hypothetical protein